MISGISSYASSYTQSSTQSGEVARNQRGGNKQEDTASNGSSSELTEAEKREVQDLKQTDRQVRQHEQAHVAAGGDLVTSGASFTFRRGPDGQSYAVAGEVQIDTSKANSPEETRIKAQRIRAAALAPADPSGQDRQVAAMATQMAMEAAQEIARQSQSGGVGGEGNGKGADTGAVSADSSSSAGAGLSSYRAMAAGGTSKADSFSAYA